MIYEKKDTSIRLSDVSQNQGMRKKDTFSAFEWIPNYDLRKKGYIIRLSDVFQNQDMRKKDTFSAFGCIPKTDLMEKGYIHMLLLPYNE